MEQKSLYEEVKGKSFSQIIKGKIESLESSYKSFVEEKSLAQKDLDSLLSIETEEEDKGEERQELLSFAEKAKDFHGKAEKENAELMFKEGATEDLARAQEALEFFAKLHFSLIEEVENLSEQAAKEKQIEAKKNIISRCDRSIGFVLQKIASLEKATKFIEKYENV